MDPFEEFNDWIDNLAVSLQERFLYWLIFCPIWIVGVLD
jgi:hypothetical protein